MRLTAVAVLAWLVLLLQPAAAQQNKRTCVSGGSRNLTFADLVRFASNAAVPASILVNFAEALGFPNQEIPSRRFSFLTESTDTFWGFDFPSGYSDIVMFKRDAQTSLLFWRMSSSGALLVTAQADTKLIQRVSNSAFEKERAAVCDFFFDRASEGLDKKP